MATLVLVMLAFSPSLFASSSQRIYRDVYIDAVATLAIGLAFVVAAEIQTGRVTRGDRTTRCPKAHAHRSTSRGWPRRILPFLLAVLIGVALGFAAVTKPT